MISNDHLKELSTKLIEYKNIFAYMKRKGYKRDDKVYIKVTLGIARYINKELELYKDELYGRYNTLLKGLEKLDSTLIYLLKCSDEKYLEIKNAYEKDILALFESITNEIYYQTELIKYCAKL